MDGNGGGLEAALQGDHQGGELNAEHVEAHLGGGGGGCCPVKV